jgi:hypothetical protein
MLTKLKLWFWNILVAFDQLCNAILGGDPAETLSSRMGKKNKSNCPLCFWICKFLDVLQRNHCENSIVPDRGSRNVIT